MASARLQPTPTPLPPLPPSLAPGAKAGLPWQRWNTLQKFWASVYLIWVLDVVLLLAAIFGARVHRDAMTTIGRHTGPSVVHALHIKYALSDMDASVANKLLGAPGQMRKEDKDYEERRKEASTELIEAAKNIALDQVEHKPAEKIKAEQDPIVEIQVAMGTYEAMVQHALDLHEQNDTGYVEAYRQAAAVMDNQLLVEADKLDKVNHDELEGTYDSVSSDSVLTVILLLMAGAGLVTALVGVQKFLSRKTHRTLNPMLLLSTIIAIWFIFFTFQTLAGERHRLRVAKEDAFTSIHALWRASATAYSANADESRYLLDTAHKMEHQRNFDQKVIALAGLRNGVSWEQEMSQARGRRKLTNLTGYLAEEMNNITFDGERAAALATLDAFGRYIAIDYRIRELEEKGNHAQAVSLGIGEKTGESNWAFDRFDEALDKTIDINQKAFDDAVKRGLEALGGFELTASIVAVGIALLAFFGMLQRIKEYQ